MSAFDRIAGYKKEKEELRALVDIFNNRKKYERKGATLPKGIIFYGPAGTGKTLFSEVLAEECSLKKINISISDSASENNLCKNIRRAFSKGAKAKAPTMIFFDELDKVLPNESEEYCTDKSKAVLAQLLTLIDGMEAVGNVVFVATCNDYYSLPESITRPGRFDKKICLDIPDISTRAAVLDMYMKASATAFAMTGESIAKLTGGFSPAALKTLVNECILVSDENNYISEDVIRDKITEIKEEDIPSERSEKSYAVDAVRNLGAFIVARAYSKSDYVLTVDESKVSNSFLDAVIAGADDDDFDDDDDDDFDYDDYGEDSRVSEISVFSKNDIIAAITALLGGVAAEQLIFKKTYNNLSNSLSTVSSLLLEMTKNGMMGIDIYYDPYEDLPYPESIKEKCGEAIIKTKLDCYERARELVEKNETLIKKLIPILVKRKSIEKEECEKIIEELGGISE